jgi:hypothetical protein
VIDPPINKTEEGEVSAGIAQLHVNSIERGSCEVSKGEPAGSVFFIIRFVADWVLVKSEGKIESLWTSRDGPGILIREVPELQLLKLQGPSIELMTNLAKPLTALPDLFIARGRKIAIFFCKARPAESTLFLRVNGSETAPVEFFKRMQTTRSSTRTLIWK